MRTVGCRTERPLTFHASTELFVKGVDFNDEIHRTFSTQNNGVKRGVYHFKSHQEANEHQLKCIAEKMARLAMGADRG
ncbi:MAG: hypothetical protein M0T84_15510 [Betaproteobacteria bacterium]|nr:hypothetical protein [Betaproteobacteria bacterium]